MDPISLAVLLNVLLEVVRRPLLYAATVLAFVATSVLCLVLSGVVFRGWWQGLFQGVGLSLLFVGVVNLGILAALRGLIEGPSRDSTAGLTPGMAELRDAMKSLERKLAELS